MAKLTITEAMAECKTLTKRIEKKRAAILPYLFRQEKVKDPFEKDGGTVEYIKRERQAIGDLEKRLVRIRAAISLANLQNEISVGAVTMSIFDWLTWRREVSEGQKKFSQQILSALQSGRKQATQQQLKLVSAESLAQSPEDIIVNVSEPDVIAEVEAIEEILGTLDGQLSLKNATIVVEIGD